MMTSQDGLLHLIDIIRYDKRPKLYEETVKTAEQAQMYHAKESEKQRKPLEQIRVNENQDQKDQRVRLTNAVTSVALGPIYSYAEQVWRTDGVKKDIETDAPENIKTLVNDHYKQYYKSESLHRYCFSAALHYTKVDPNAWTVFEVEFGTGEQGQQLINDFYPVEVLSHEVRGYSEDSTGTLEYLSFEFMRKVYDPKNPKNSRSVSDFYFYAAGFSIHLAEIDKYYTDGKDYEAMGYEVINIPGTSREFWGQVFMNTTTEVPAIRWSAYLSTESNRKIGETLVASAIPVLEEMLKDNSLLQLIKYLHAYPEKHQYVRRCNHQDEEGLDCINGYYGGHRDKEHICRQCQGTGKLIATSEQDTVTIAYPDRAEDLFDLSVLTHYVERPIDILIQYREMVAEKFQKIFTAVYNQSNVDAGTLVTAKTATESRIEYDKIYNKLSSFTELIALAWELGIRVGYQYYNRIALANMTYPFDMKMKSVMDLLIEFDAAKNSGAPYEVINSITADILTKQHRNQPTKAADIMAFERWRPWKDKSSEEIALIIQNRDKLDSDRVLWENWAKIMEVVKLSLSGLPFSLLPDADQKAELYRATEAIKGEIMYTSISDMMMPAVPMGEDLQDDVIE